MMNDGACRVGKRQRCPPVTGRTGLFASPNLHSRRVWNQHHVSVKKPGLMKIGFDISQTGSGKAGCGYFADSVIQQLAEIDFENEYLLYPTFGNFFWDPAWRKSTRRIDRPNFRRAQGHRTREEAQSFWANPPEGLEAYLGGPQIFHSNNFFCPSSLKSALLVYTLYDLSFLEYPDLHTEPNRLGCFKGVFNASLYADMVISISEYSRRHFLEIFPHFPPDRIRVAHLASRFSHEPNLARPSSLASLNPDEFWLNVGTVEPRKNQFRLLKAYARLKAASRKTYPLVMAGGRGWLMAVGLEMSHPLRDDDQHRGPGADQAILGW